MCARLAPEHAAFFARIREEGARRACLAAQAAQGLTLEPQVSALLAMLGIRLERALAAGSRP